MYANEQVIIHQKRISDIVNNPEEIEKIRKKIDEGVVFIIKEVGSKELIKQLKHYLTNVMQSSLPEFVPIEEGAKNNYRVNFEDERAQINAFFHCWSFFTWNQDLLQLYEKFSDVYRLRNLIAGLPSETFLGRHAEIDCAARLSVQFYPSGRGHFAPHEDPFDQHQVVVPIMSMSKQGEGFRSGGNYVRVSDTAILNTESLMEVGDVLLFNSLCEHGVELIDEGEDYFPLNDRGRWMMLFAVNKTASNLSVPAANPK